MSVDDLVATIESKMNQAKADYFRVLDLAQMGKASPIRVSYHNGLYDGLERAWREAVFAKIEMEKAKGE
jgi:hypothetical protein